MNVDGGAQPLPYGHTAEAAVDIEGLAVSFLKHCISLFLVYLLCALAP
jgi:hypothetical protein